MQIDKSLGRHTHTELERVSAEEDWFLAAREQAMCEIILLMMRYEINIIDLVIHPREQRDCKD